MLIVILIVGSVSTRVGIDRFFLIADVYSYGEPKLEI